MNKVINCLFGMIFAASVTVASAVFAEDAPEGPRQLDRLELDTSSIKGNQELPKVLYIVPWKDAAVGALDGKPVNSLMNEVLAPVDREVFKRQVKYFDQLQAAKEPAAAE